MQNALVRKGLVVGIIVLFVGTSVVSSMRNDSGTKGTTNQNNAPTTDWWPMFQHDLNHSGYSASKAPETNATLWIYLTSSSSSPAIENGKVYEAFGVEVCCLNESDGLEIWNYSTENTVYSSPAVANGRVYFGSDDYKVYCLNASTGACIWSTGISYFVRSSPAVADGKVYIGSDDNKVYCLNASTGAYIWSYTTSNWVESSPAVADGKVYIGSDIKVYCLNASTGAYIWSYTTGSLVGESSPAVANGKVYIGSWDCKVYCLDASTGAYVWSYTTGGFVDSPAVADGKVYIGSQDNKLYCLNALTGIYIWDYTAGNFIGCSPAVADGKVYIQSWDGNVYCLNVSTGTYIWSCLIGSGPYSSPAVADGKVFIGGGGGNYCFGQGGENQPPNTPTVPSGPTSLILGESGVYSTSTADPDGDLIQYQFDFNASGSHDYSGWTLWVPSGQTSSVTYTWSHAGTYVVKAEAKDVHGAYSDWSDGLTVVIGGGKHNVIIVCGSVNISEPGDAKVIDLERTADMAYQTFKSLGYSDDDIMYLSGGKNYSEGVDGRDYKTNISGAITYWLKNRLGPNSDYIFYFIGHAGNTGSLFVQDPIDYSTLISPGDLSNWFDNITIYHTGIFLIESCYSGYCIAALNKTNERRIILTSTNKTTNSSVHGGYADFSHGFFNALATDGTSYGQAWEAGDKKVAALSYHNSWYSIIKNPLMKITKNKMNEFLYLPNFMKEGSTLSYRSNLSLIEEVPLLKYSLDSEKQNPQINDNGDGIGAGSVNADTLPLWDGIGYDGNLALNTYP